VAQASAEPVESSYDDDIDLPASARVQERIEARPASDGTAHALVAVLARRPPAVTFDELPARFLPHRQRGPIDLLLGGDPEV
jgi:hypothetical protein